MAVYDELDLAEKFRRFLRLVNRQTAGLLQATAQERVRISSHRIKRVCVIQ